MSQCVFFVSNFTYLAQITLEIFASDLNDPLYACIVKTFEILFFEDQQKVSKVSTNEKCFSDHMLIKACFPVVSVGITRQNRVG